MNRQVALKTNNTVERVYRSNEQELPKEEATSDRSTGLDRFLASVERRAVVTARIATGNPDDALDLVQDAMLALAQRYADRPEQEWGPLFTTILQSRIRDWYRRSKVRNRLRVWLGRDDDEESVDPVGELPDADEPGPVGRLRNQRAMSALEEALHQLPLRQQQAFILRTWDGLDTRDTAQAMGCSEGSVKTHYSRACASLREALKEYEP
jgi:RNA polymerase sigma-70 factor (ECF subfamily)